MLHKPSTHSRLCAKHFTEDSFEQTLVLRRLLAPSFKLCHLALKKDAVPLIFNFIMERCKPAIGQENNEKQGNNARRTAGELVSHFPNKKRFVFRSKTFPMKDSMT